MAIYIGCVILGIFALIFRFNFKWQEEYGFLFIIACIFWIIVAAATMRREWERKKMMQEIDLRIADKSSDYLTNVIGNDLRDSLQRLECKLIRYFIGQKDKIKRVKAIYSAIDNAGVKYKDVYISIRHLLDPATTTMQSNLFESVNYPGKDEKTF